VPNLIAKSALFGRAPLTLSGTMLAEAQIGPITSVAAFPGKLPEITQTLGGFPAPNSVSGNLIWTGPEQVFVLGQAPDLVGLAAVTDQTGGWAALRLSGPHAADALMRLYPLDLRAAHFPKDTCARAPLGHMQSILIAEDTGFLILIFRSMARTAWHEIETALQALTARASAT
jgi:heterotetrameric sarcosine oxidase gamma subunit